MGREQKEERRGRGGGGKEKPAAEPLHFTKRRSSTNGRQLGITTGQSCVNQNDQCQQFVNRFSGMIRSDEFNIVVVEDNSLEFALPETARGFSRSGKNQWLPPRR